MATTQIIQLLSPEASGGTAGSMNRTQTETFIANGSITKGHFVAFDTGKTGSDRVLYVIQSAGVATVGNSLTIGVALATAAAGEKIDVCVSGYCAYAYVDGSTVAGTPLCGPIGTAGQAGLAAAATTSPVIAVGLDADTANFAPVFVTKVF